MQKRPTRVLVALVLSLAGCDSVGTPVEPMDDPSYSTSAWIDLVTTDVSVTDETTVQVVGRRGGEVHAGQHSLFIPRGAVSEDTEFSVRLVGGDYIQVELGARRVSDGAEVSTFSKDLLLRLSYADADVSDPYSLTNVYLADGTTDGTLEALASYVSFSTQTVSSPISHFSGYAMGMN